MLSDNSIKGELKPIDVYIVLVFDNIYASAKSFSFLFLNFGATQRSLRRQAQDVRKAVEGGSTEGILSFDDIGPNITHHFLVRKPKNILLCHRSSSRKH